MPSDEDAQDIAQEAFLRVFRNLERFNFDHEFTTWLYRIVTNLCIDFLRKRRVAVSVSRGKEGDDGEESALDLEDQGEPAPWEYAEAAETASEVHEVLADPRTHFQSVLTLREIEGLGCPEIAEIVGATHVTVRWRLHRGRKLFQEEWERRARMRQQGAANLIQSGAAEGADISAPTPDQEHRTNGARNPRGHAIMRQGSDGNDGRTGDGQSIRTREEFESSLPLFVGGDLDPADERAVEGGLLQHPEDRGLLDAAERARDVLKEHGQRVRAAGSRTSGRGCAAPCGEVEVDSRPNRPPTSFSGAQLEPGFAAAAALAVATGIGFVMSDAGSVAGSVAGSDGEPRRSCQPDGVRAHRGRWLWRGG